MSLFEAIILSLIEGITEFLPISSTGHLILASNILQIPQSDFIKSFEIFIQSGAILAVLVLYWKKLLLNREILKRIILAFIPTAILGFGLYKVVKHLLLGNTYVSLISLFIGGIVLIIFEKLYKEKPHHLEKCEEMSLKNSFLIGIFQSLSIIPGVSRAAATIVGGLILGYKRTTAVEFSFLLAIPTMFAATFLDLAKSSFNFSHEEYFLLFIGFIGAFLSALLAVKTFLQFIQKHTFIPFGIYRIFLAILFWLFLIR